VASEVFVGIKKVNRTDNDETDKVRCIREGTTCPIWALELSIAFAMMLLSIVISGLLGFVCLLRLVPGRQYLFSRALLTLNTSLTLNNIHRSQRKLLTDLGYMHTLHIHNSSVINNRLS